MTTVYRHVVDAFLAEGTDTVFGLMGDGNMFWFADMATRPSVRVVHARHEAAALAMADGWAQSTGRVGVCSVTCGPGITNLVTSLRVAAHNRSPVVVLAGDTPMGSAVHYQSFDVGSLRVLAGVEVFNLRSQRELDAKIRAAFATARRDLRPVVLALPYDLAEEPCGLEPYVDRQISSVPTPVRVGDLEAVRERVSAARRVLLLVGRGAVASGALDLVDELADRLGATTGSTVKALGALHHRSGDLGVVGMFSSEADKAIVAQCDLVLALGTSLSWFTTLDGVLLAPERTIQVVDRVDAWDPGYVFEPGLKVVADCRVLLEQLLKAIPAGRRPGARRTDPVALPSGLSDGVAADDGLDPVAALATVRRRLTEQVQLIVGAGHFWNHVVEMSEPPDPRRLQVHNGFGAIAQAFPASLGAAVAVDDLPTVVVEGDGSLMMNIQELETAARSGIVLLVLVMNDGAYGAEYHKLTAAGLNAKASLFGYVDFGGVAEALGCRARTPATLEELGDVVTEFLEHPLLTVVDVRLTRRVRARRYRAPYVDKKDLTGAGC